MATSKFIQHDTIKSLKKKLKEKYYADIRDRIRALIMISKKYSYSEIADTLGFSIQWVKKLAVDYTRDGLESLMPGLGRLKGLLALSQSIPGPAGTELTPRW